MPDCPIDLVTCDFVQRFPAQYFAAPNIMASVEAQAELLVCDANVRNCGAFDCDTAEGEVLTLIGEQLGFPRSHCNSAVTPIFGYICELEEPDGTSCPEQNILGYCQNVYYYCRLNDRSDYLFVDDDLYRGFVKAQAIRNRIIKNKEVPNTQRVDEVIKALWGPTAYVVLADNNVMGVTAGRDLTATEINIISIYRKVIPVGLGIRLDIYCVDPDLCNQLYPPVAPPDITVTDLQDLL